MVHIQWNLNPVNRPWQNINTTFLEKVHDKQCGDVRCLAEKGHPAEKGQSLRQGSKVGCRVSSTLS